jgi:hypothetical protein
MGIFDFVSDAFDGIVEIANDVATGVGKVVTDVGETVGDLVSDGVDYAIENPGKTLLMVGGTIATGGAYAGYASAARVGSMAVGALVGSTANASTGTIATAATIITTENVAMGFAASQLAKKSSSLMMDPIHLKPGAIVHCGLYGAIEHSGIYIGNGNIIELTGKNSGGKIQVTNFDGFTDGTGHSTIYAACHNGRLLYSDNIKNRAIAKSGGARNYNLITENCHIFTSECITGEASTNTFFTFLELEIKKYFDVNDIEWRKAIV